MMKVWLVLTFLGNHGFEAHKKLYQMSLVECMVGVTAQFYAAEALKENPSWMWDRSWTCRAGGLEQDS